MNVQNAAQKVLTAVMLAVNVVLIGTLGYFIWTRSGNFSNPFVPPCSKPVTYSIGRFDKPFGMSQKDFIDAISQAEKIWEVSIDKNLFAYATTGGQVTVNLIYDSRQEATQKLQRMGIALKDDRASYDALKKKYEAEKTLYLKQKTAVDAAVKAFDARRAAWEKTIAYWNAQGGAPESERKKLEQERDAINVQAAKINADTAALNDTIDTLNALGSELNRLIAVLNLAVQKYNTTSLANGEEFEEGEYKVDVGVREINIYQFSDKRKLVRVLAHELGHALGLEHVDDAEAIMYRLNSGQKDTLTEADIAELKALCGIK